MTYTKTVWRDQLVERPKTYEFSNNQDGSVTLIESFGNVTELGTPVNAVNMNHIENGLADTDVTKYNVNTTYSTGEWVTGVVNSVKGIYVSKTDSNTGNALTNTAYWEEVELSPNKANLNLNNVNDSGKITGSFWAMPSISYDTLTAGASGTVYTAPSNGYLVASGMADTQDIKNHPILWYLMDDTGTNIVTLMCIISYAFGEGETASFIPVRKGGKYRLDYGRMASINVKFIYAVGSESEAS